MFGVVWYDMFVYVAFVLLMFMIALCYGWCDLFCAVMLCCDCCDGVWLCCVVLWCELCLGLFWSCGLCRCVLC